VKYSNKFHPGLPRSGSLSVTSTTHSLSSSSSSETNSKELLADIPPFNSTVSDRGSQAVSSELHSDHDEAGTDNHTLASTITTDQRKAYLLELVKPRQTQAFLSLQACTDAGSVSSTQSTTTQRQIVLRELSMQKRRQSVLAERNAIILASRENVNTSSIVKANQSDRSSKPPPVPLRMELICDGFEVVRLINECIRKPEEAREKLNEMKGHSSSVKEPAHSALAYETYVKVERERHMRPNVKIQRYQNKLDEIAEASSPIEKSVVDTDSDTSETREKMQRYRDKLDEMTLPPLEPLEEGGKAKQRKLDHKESTEGSSPEGFRSTQGAAVKKKQEVLEPKEVQKKGKHVQATAMEQLMDAPDGLKIEKEYLVDLISYASESTSFFRDSESVCTDSESFDSAFLPDACSMFKYLDGRDSEFVYSYAVSESYDSAFLSDACFMFECMNGAVDLSNDKM